MGHHMTHIKLISYETTESYGCDSYDANLALSPQSVRHQPDQHHHARTCTLQDGQATQHRPRIDMAVAFFDGWLYIFQERLQLQSL